MAVSVSAPPIVFQKVAATDVKIVQISAILVIPSVKSIGRPNPKIPPSLNDVAALEYLLSFFPMLSSLTLQIYHIFISLT